MLELNQFLGYLQKKTVSSWSYTFSLGLDPMFDGNYIRQERDDNYIFLFIFT